MSYLTNSADARGEVSQTVTLAPNPWRWLWWLLGLLALSAVMWALTRQCEPAEIEAAPPPPPAITTPPVTTPPVVAPPPATTPVATPPATPAPTEPEVVIDWANYPIIVNGVGIPDNFITIGDDEIFPTHTPLVPVAIALETGEVVTMNYAGEEYGTNPHTVALTGRNGAITATIGSNEVIVNDQVITLPANVELVDDEIYVPLLFWRDAYGVGEATFHGGQVVINDAPGER